MAGFRGTNWLRGCVVTLGVIAGLAAAARGWTDDEPPARDVETVADLLLLVIDANEEAARECLLQLADKIQNREVADERLKQLATRLREMLGERLKSGADDALHAEVAVVATSLREPAGIAAARRIATDGKRTVEHRQSALGALLFSGDPAALELAAEFLADVQKHNREVRGMALATLGRSELPRVAEIVLVNYGKLEPDLQPKAIELLTQRPAWSKSLLQAIGRQEIPAHALNANQVAKLLASRDVELQKLVAAKWGTVRNERNPQREQVIANVRERLGREQANPLAGQKVFQKLCGQCHKIYGEGQEVGPDITVNGRASVEQLLSNVLDPSLVIGASYQARTVITSDGRVLTGLLAEDSPQRVILKVQGGKLETIARDDVDELRVSPLSLMPEGLENQLQPQELLDLFAFLVLDKPPQDPAAKRIPTK